LLNQFWYNCNYR